MASELALLFLSLSGFFLSLYIFFKRKYKEKLKCVIGKECNRVLYSKFSSQFGVSNEIMGIIYYSLIFISSLLFLTYPNILNYFLTLSRTIVVGVAMLFSIYLSTIQIFILREYCEYCLAANLINVFIFISIFY